LGTNISVYETYCLKYKFKASTIFNTLQCHVSQGIATGLASPLADFPARERSVQQNSGRLSVGGNADKIRGSLCYYPPQIERDH
jgi:hypothetical protein